MCTRRMFTCNMDLKYCLYRLGWNYFIIIVILIKLNWMKRKAKITLLQRLTTFLFQDRLWSRSHGDTGERLKVTIKVLKLQGRQSRCTATVWSRSTTTWKSSLLMFIMIQTLSWWNWPTGNLELAVQWLNKG